MAVASTPPTGRPPNPGSGARLRSPRLGDQRRVGCSLGAAVFDSLVQGAGPRGGRPGPGPADLWQRDSARHRRLRRHRGRSPPIAPPPAPDHNRRRPDARRLLASAPAVGRRSAHDAVPRAPAGQARREKAISKKLVAKLVAWRHPGFSAHVGDRIAAEDKRRLEDTAACLARIPFPLRSSSTWTAKSRALPLEAEFVPGAKLRADGCLQWLARMSDHIPDPGPRTARCSTASTPIGSGEAGARARPKRARRRRGSRSASAARSPSWARLITQGLRGRSAPLHPL